jgi:DNA mismatch repair protein MutS2
LADFFKLSEIENSKRKKATVDQKQFVAKKKKLSKKFRFKSMKLEPPKEKLKPQLKNPKAIIRLGDRVRMF